jgi:hypothetical protein
MNAPSTEMGSGWRTLGVVRAACVACCAAPLLAAVGSIGVLGSAATFAVSPAAGLAVPAATIVAVVYLRRQATGSAGSAAVPVRLSSRPRASSASERP